MHMLSDHEIERARPPTSQSRDNDCVRIAYEWLDAQRKTKAKSKVQNPLKHIIECWAGRYVPKSAVEVAATLHPDIQGRYPFYTFRSRLTEPSQERLRGILGARGSSSHRRGQCAHFYTYHER
jgi:hypothetical protein